MSTIRSAAAATIPAALVAGLLVPLGLVLEGWRHGATHAGSLYGFYVMVGLVAGAVWWSALADSLRAATNASRPVP